MMSTTKALELALEALESCTPADTSTSHVVWPSYDEQAVKQASTAIKQALAAQTTPVQEIEYCKAYHCAGDCGQPHNQKEMRDFLTAQPAPVQEQDGPITEGWSIHFSNGHSGLGVYAHLDEYPEEGAILLCGIPKWASDALKATPPAAQRQSAPDPKDRRSAWVGLTHEEIVNDDDFIHENIYSAIRSMESKLKLRNT
jgi:hypothetical protein